MKKTIATLALILTATTASADMSNPVTKMEAEIYFEKVMPMLTLATACDASKGIKATRTVLDNAYAVFGGEMFDKDLIDMEFSLAKMKVDRKFKKDARVIKKNIDNPKIVELCSGILSKL